MGKLQVHKSGKVSLKLGDVWFKVSIPQRTYSKIATYSNMQHITCDMQRSTYDLQRQVRGGITAASPRPKGLALSCEH